MGSVGYLGSAPATSVFGLASARLLLAARGSGLVGLKDRIENLAGAFTIDSQLRAGTTGPIEVPLKD